MNRGNIFRWLHATLLAVLMLNWGTRPALADLSAMPREATWVTNGTVNAIARTSDTIYLGGAFTYVGPYTGCGVPINTSTGQATTVFPKVRGQILCCASDGSGGWYIGGDFGQVGALARNRLAHILANGTVDAAWNPYANGNVAVLAVSGGTIYVGGSFNSISDQPRNRIAALDATTGVPTAWNPNASGGTFPDSVLTLAVVGSTVYAGGDFSIIGGQTRVGLAALDATTGMASDWNPNVNGIVRTMAVSGETVYVGGSFNSIGGQTRNFIGAVNTTSGAPTAWNPTADSTVYALAVSGGVVYVGGYFSNIGGRALNKIAALDATTGMPMDWNPSADKSVTVLAVSGTTLYAGGDFSSIGGQVRNRIAALDTATGLVTAWSSNADNAINALAVSGGTVYAGGSFKSIGGQMRKNIAALDVATGAVTTWIADADNTVYALAVSGGVVYAGGWFSTIGKLVRTSIAALDATTGDVTDWNPNTNGGGIYALAVSGGVVYAGGWFSSIGGQTRRNIAALNTTTGNATTWDPSANSTVQALAVTRSAIYVGGQFTTIGGQTRNRIAALDPTSGNATTWDPSANGYVYALAVSGETVYAGGAFSDIGGQTRNNIAALSATSGAASAWNPNARKSSASDAYVSALAISDMTVYAGGGFFSIGGQWRNNIAALDATSGAASAWNPNPGSSMGFSTQVNALSANSSTVYAGGTFDDVGGQQRVGFAQYQYGPPPAAPTTPGAAAITLNSITWTWQDLSSDESGFRVYGGPGATAPDTPTATTAANTTQWPQTGLRANTQYAFQVAATNSFGDSEKMDSINTYTLIEAVSGLTFSDIGDHSISVAASITPSNLAAGNSGLYFTNTTSGTDSGWQQNNTPWVSGSLTPNTHYDFSAQSRNGAGIGTAPTAASVYTLAATPATPVVSNPQSHSLAVAIGVGDGNPATTEYALYCVTTARWVQANGSLGASPVWGTAAAWGTKTVTGLNGVTSYAFQTRARNAKNAETANSPSGSGTTDCTLSFTAGAHGSIRGTNPQTVNYGTSATAVTAVAATGYHFVNWTLNGRTYSFANPLAVTRVTANMTFTAVFAINTYMVSFQTDGRRGATLRGTTRQTINYGASGTAVKANAPAGWRFLKWTMGSKNYAYSNPLTVSKVAANMVLVANFVPIQYAVSFQTDGTRGATLTGSKTQTVNSGASATAVKAVAPAGWRFVKWTKGGASYSTANPLTVSKVAANMTLVATFKKK